jgi:hypothetical protein
MRKVELKKYQIKDFKNGWFVGDFEPTLFKTSDFEVCVKFFKQGETEVTHKQLVATELTVVITGHVRMSQHRVNAGEILCIEPGEYSDFEALSDCMVVGVKFPSIPHDKIIKGDSQ